ncbi:MAG: regulatory iron-sulfur-containing complex subunit RicT [Anaerolineae bacterium]|nr:regulatory iron-sulfur-containing complex subunit RicT [Anaerolineae bacterium]
MPTVVGISLKPVSKIYYFSPGRLDDLTAGEYVIVETARGQALGQVVMPPREVPETEIPADLKPVLRRATAWDAIQQDQYHQREAETLARTREIVAQQNLPMKVVGVEYSFDGSRLTVYFSAEKRVDFRNLVKELSKTFRTAVEMRQIGARDEARLLNGYGRCGYRLCCAAWMREFAPVSIRLAKLQDLPLNPEEISGCCGRLLCCLRHESDVYAEALARLPQKRSKVLTKHGEAIVERVNPLKETVVARLEGSETLIEVEMSELVTAEADKQAPRPRRARGRRRSSSRRRAKPQA